MFTHKVIKRIYSEEGYLPDYPWHLISDEEMFEAFLPLSYFNLDEDKDEVTFGPDEWEAFMNDTAHSVFKDNYPNVNTNLTFEYKCLVADIVYHILMYLKDDSYSIPSWVYSYMLRETIGVSSDKQDIHDLLVMLVCDNIDDDFDATAAAKCLAISNYYRDDLKRRDKLHRPATVFGEPHVIRYLRLRSLA